MELSGSGAMNGTVDASRANFTIISQAWKSKAHYDYVMEDGEHGVVHLHPDNSTKLCMHVSGEEALNHLPLGLSDYFRDFLDEMDRANVDVFQPEGPTAEGRNILATDYLNVLSTSYMKG